MRRRLRRGLTLIETLVVLTIAAILIAVLLTVLFPSDARRCRLEAERLAAWMMAASAESVMRDAPVRVVVDIGSGTVKREVARVGASFTDNLWEQDDKAEVFEVDEPVRIDAVDSAASEDLRSGTGYVIFRGEQTEGAAVVLGVEEVYYSVVIPPSGGTVEVVEGRKGRPGGNPGLDRTLAAFGQPLDTGGELGNLKEGSVGGVVAPPVAPRGTGSARPRGNRSGNNNNNSNNNNNNNTDAPSSSDAPPTPTPTPPTATPKAPAPTPTPEPTPEPTPDPTPDTPPGQTGGGFGQGCNADSQCGGQGGWGACLNGGCVPDPIGNALRLSSASLVSPNVAGVTAVVNSAVGAQVFGGELNLLIYFDADRNWIVQGERTNVDVVTPEGLKLGLYKQSSTLPTYSGVQSDDNTLSCNYETNACSANIRVAGTVRLFIPDPTLDEGCTYQVLEIIPELTVDFTVSDSLTSVVADNSARPRIELRAAVTREAARKINTPQGDTLDRLLMEARPLSEESDDVIDTDDDGDADAWIFVFRGDGQEVRFPDVPYEDAGAAPENCN